MHFFSSSSQCVVLSKNCIVITSDRLRTFSFKRILKQSCAVFALSSCVTSSILHDTTCTKQNWQDFYSHWFFLSRKTTTTKTKLTLNEEFEVVNFFFRKFLCQFTEPNAKRNIRSTIGIKLSYEWHVIYIWYNQCAKKHNSHKLNYYLKKKTTFE